VLADMEPWAMPPARGSDDGIKPLSRRVRGDMDEIFAAAPPSVPPAGLSSRPIRIVPPAQARPRAWTGRIAVAVAALATMAVAVAVDRSREPPKGDRSAFALVPAPITESRQPEPPAAITPMEKAHPAPPVHPKAARAHRRDTNRTELADRHIQAGHGLKARLAACGDLDENSHRWCMRPTVMQADRELRQAYRHAVRAGVSRSVLRSYREEWADLRSDAAHDPRRMITGYQRMAHELSARTHRRGQRWANR